VESYKQVIESYQKYRESLRQVSLAEQDLENVKKRYMPSVRMYYNNIGCFMAKLKEKLDYDTFEKLCKRLKFDFYSELRDYHVFEDRITIIGSHYLGEGQYAYHRLGGHPVTLLDDTMAAVEQFKQRANEALEKIEQGKIARAEQEAAETEKRELRILNELKAKYEKLTDQGGDKNVI